MVLKNFICPAVMVVGALIFVLGIDLVKEALWDTRHRVNRLEYVTIISIMVCMTVWDFVAGVLFGIVVSCKMLFSSYCVLLNAFRRLLLRCTKFATEEHPSPAHRRDSHVYRSKTGCS